MKKLLSLILATMLTVLVFPGVYASEVIPSEINYMLYGTFDEDGGPTVGPVTQTGNLKPFFDGWSAYEVYNVYNPDNPDSDKPVCVVDGRDNPFSIYDGDEVVVNNGKAMKVSLNGEKRSYLQYLNKFYPDAAEDGVRYTGTRAFEMDFMLEGDYGHKTNANAFFHLSRGAIYARANTDRTFDIGMFVGTYEGGVGTNYRDIVKSLNKGQNYHIKFVYSLVDTSSEHYVDGGIARSVALYVDGEKVFDENDYIGNYLRTDPNLNYMKDTSLEPNYGLVYTGNYINAGWRLGFFGSTADADLHGYVDNIKYYGIEHEGYLLDSDFNKTDYITEAGNYNVDMMVHGDVGETVSVIAALYKKVGEDQTLADVQIKNVTFGGTTQGQSAFFENLTVDEILPGESYYIKTLTFDSTAALTPVRTIITLGE